ncbi:hypothetical protein ACP4OV_015314 [Aristida adscensionis]
MDDTTRRQCRCLCNPTTYRVIARLRPLPALKLHASDHLLYCLSSEDSKARMRQPVATMARRGHSPRLLLGTVLLLFAAAAAQDCASATFQPGRSFQRCTALPALGASLSWTYHPASGTVDLAFRAPQSAAGWVAWGINTAGRGMVGSSVFAASHDAAGGVAPVLMTVLESFSPSLTNGSLKFDVPVAPAADYSGGAYTVYATVALPGNATQQNTVWQAGPVSGGRIAPHPTAEANMQSTMTLDFLTGGRSTGASSSRVHRRNMRSFRG